LKGQVSALIREQEKAASCYLGWLGGSIGAIAMTVGGRSREAVTARRGPVRTAAHDVQYALYARFSRCIRDSLEII
jgi:hypothetical protein